MSNVNLINTKPNQHKKESLLINKQQLVKKGQETIDEIKSVQGLLLTPLQLHLVHNMELRKIPPASRSKYVCLGAFVILPFSCKFFLRLCEILSSEGQWKTVMASVPAPEGSSFRYKYTTDHVNIIESHSRKTGKMGMDILIDEWGTSGKVRPTVEDLYLICDDLELFRAADFILDSLLDGDKPTKVITNSIKVEKPLSEKSNNGSGIKTKNAESCSEGKPNIQNFNIPKDLDTDELNKQLDSLILESQEQKSPVLEEAALDSINVLTTTLPHFNFGFLQTLTNNFCDVPFSTGGNKIGAGAFGSVYYGRLSGQLGLANTAVAVKRIARDMIKNEEQFNNEVEIMALVSHPNLLTLLAYSCDGEDLCLLYPYMENGSLEDRLAMRMTGKPALTPMQRLKIAWGTGEGLQHLHSASHTKPLVHRDVKTANILLDSNLEPKVGDFGLVRLGGGDGGLRTSTVLTQTVVGTSAYMAPEAVRGEVTVKLDVFSFGVVLLELLTGLPAMDPEREVGDLVGHVEELVEDEGDIEKFLDKKAGMLMEWRQVSPKQIYEIALKCLLRKKDRPIMAEVNEMMAMLYH